MIRYLLVFAAFAPAFFLGWKLRSIANLLGHELNEVMPHPQRSIFLLILGPWMILTTLWAAGVSLVLFHESTVEMGGQAIIAAFIALWTAGIGMAFRRNIPVVLKTLRKWIDKADEWMYVRTP